ncbi:2-phosphosulfolactate phosphatase [Thermosediminibacter litoriperuensis]|uniref:Probable 2-phosphosulfolactate phosphatase n=1 Tax=Thermosediminibacter litoriperuensis TaxID=291989 RepID=A0A5S5AQB4_9FIRM|nr:2-phosphosulfolactate phosphatase [Thermosediminibacter litoriperuensis]TYP54220.1 2-phosphosulfolactate phosphatase [Thermosediminibacter litoriperuensis]
MFIEVYPTAQSVKDLNGKTAIVIDVLRATSVITTALHNGAERVIPVPSVEDAFRLARDLKYNSLLGGERGAVKIPGFDLGNSPLEYKKELVAGKTVILTTSNGTKAIKASESAEHILIGCFLNASAAAGKALQFALSSETPGVAVVCAGTLGEFSLDDAACAGLIVDSLVRNIERMNEIPELSDLAFACRDLYLEHRHDLKAFISHAAHFKRLLGLGLEKDIDYCLQRDVINCVPVYDKRTPIIDVPLITLFTNPPF